MGNESESRSISINLNFGIFGGLFLIFLSLLVAKAIGIGNAAAWSWWIVFSPFWAIPAFVVGLMAACIAVGLIIGAIVLAIWGICELWDAIEKRNRQRARLKNQPQVIIRRK